MANLGRLLTTGRGGGTQRLSRLLATGRSAAPAQVSTGADYTGYGLGMGGGGGGAGAGGATAVTGGSDIMDLYTKALERLSTGGLSLEASLADIAEGKRQAIARGQQSLVSGGLSGTTVMGGVPVAAEKTAGRARLAARGEAESKYLTTLASFAAFAQRAQEAAADRAAALQRLKLQLGTQERLATQSRLSSERMTELSRPTQYIPESERTQEAYTYGASLEPSPERIMVSGLGPTTAARYSSRFPSIYEQGEEPVPQWI